MPVMMVGYVKLTAEFI